MHNLDYTKYLGVPFKFKGNSIEEGLDCINLCCALAKDRGVPLANVNHAALTISNVHLKFEQMEREVGVLWQEVEPQENVLVIFRINGKLRHVGYMLDNIHFIHIMEGASVTVDKITNLKWEKRIFGLY